MCLSLAKSMSCHVKVMWLRWNSLFSCDHASKVTDMHNPVSKSVYKLIPWYIHYVFLKQVIPLEPRKAKSSAPSLLKEDSSAIFRPVSDISSESSTSDHIPSGTDYMGLHSTRKVTYSVDVVILRVWVVWARPHSVAVLHAAPFLGLSIKLSLKQSMPHENCTLNI